MAARSHHGWAIELEDFAALDRLPGDDAVLALAGHYEANQLDPRDVIRVENQGPVGSCQGHALSTVCEWCACIATGHAELQLSRAMAYYWTQKIDGIRGDRGSTITGGVKLAKETGICREALWPYVPQYDPTPPCSEAEIRDDAGKFRIESEIRIRSYDAVRTFLESGQGGIEIGILWKESMIAPVVEQFAGRSRGGHAVDLIYPSQRIDRSGRPYIWLCNSHGLIYGNRGWAEVSPAAIDAMFRDRFTVMVGLSDLTTPEPRRIDWLNNSPFLI